MGQVSQTVLITGGASGIGRAVTEAVLAEGWTAIAADLSADALARCRGEISDAGDRLICEELDVADEAAVAALIDGLETAGHALTGVVNSAGTGADIPALETTAETFRKFLWVNLVGSFVVAREAARHMAGRRRGSIINIASVSGMVGNTGRVAYGASKGGILSATKVMAVEWANLGIRVNAISPGPIETPLVTRVHTAAARQAWHERVPSHRYGTPEEVAGAAMFLLDESKSSYVTGHTLVVDGGMTVAGLMHSND